MGLSRVLTCAALAFALTTQMLTANDYNPCERVIEQGMMVSDQAHLGFVSGFVVEHYRYDRGNGAPPAPVAALNEFFGVRVMQCATGRFFAIPTYETAFEVDAALSATEFLRSAVQSRSPIAYDDVLSAAEAVFSDLTRLQENEESCACSELYPELRPAKLIPFGERSNITRE